MGGSRARLPFYMQSVIGWDIGGAHLKAARAEQGRIVAVVQLPCTPHLGLAHVERAIRDAALRLGPAARHAVTMTAELSDAFHTRAQGVRSVAAMFARESGASDIFYYAGARGFVPPNEVAGAAEAIASANWRASAELVARRSKEALFIDMGSTTTDIIPIRGGALAAQGADDAGRLAHGELAYTGLLRGRPGAFTPLAPVAGRWTPLVDEAFATMADVHRTLGNIPEGADLAPTVDGRSKSRDDSRARLARLVGRDADSCPAAQWDALAAFFARAQLRAIEDQIALIFSRGAVSPDAPIVGAGIGRGVIRRWAESAGRAFRDIADFIDAAPEQRAAASDCAPAAAVALLCP